MLLAQRAPRGEQHVLVGREAVGDLQHGHLVRRSQVVVQRLRPLVGTVVIGAGQQVLHELAADPELGVGQPAQPGQLHGQDGGTMLEGHDVRTARAAVRVDQDEQAEHAGARRGQRHHAVAVPDRTARGHHPAEQLRPEPARVPGRLRLPGGTSPHVNKPRCARQPA